LVELHIENANDTLSAESDYMKLQELKIDLKIQEDNFNELTEKKIEYQRKINNFNSQYMVKFGNIIEEILRFRALSFRENTNGKKQAQQVYQSFKESHQQQLRNLPNELTATEKLSLKVIYHKAIYLCNLYTFFNYSKSQEELLCKSLNDAYVRQDLKTVQEVLMTLSTEITRNKHQHDYHFTASDIEKKTGLLRKSNITLQKEIEDLQVDETHKRLQKIKNISVFFNDLEQSLKAELKALQQGKLA
jgi:hypothetical protein